MPFRPQHAPSLTRRPLRWNDASIDELSPAQRTIASRLWLARASGERTASATFERLVGSLARLGAGDAVIGVARRAIDDEARHAEICRRVASRYLGREIPMPTLHRAPLPRYAGAPQGLRDTLHVVLQCAINETTASAFLDQALADTTAPLARGALRELMRDEIDHARIGWAHLASAVAQPGVREAMSDALPGMLQMNLRGWRRERAGRPDAALRSHGCPTLTEIDTAVVDAMRALIVPGFQRVGVDTRAAERWIDTSVRPLTECA